MISTNILVGIKFIGFFGLILWFGLSQAKSMERQIAEDKRRKAENARTAA